MRKFPTIQLADPSEDQARPESIAMVAVAAWGVGFVIMLGVARFLPHDEGMAEVTQAARAQLPGTEAEPTRIVSTTRGLGDPHDAHIVRPAPLAEAHAAEIEQEAIEKPAATSEPSEPSEPNERPASATEPSEKPAPAPSSELIAKPAPASEAIAKPLPAAPQPAAPLVAASDGDRTSAKSATSLAKKRTTKREFKPGVLAYLRCEGSERPHARFPCPRDPKLEEQVWHALEALPMCDTDPGAGTAELRLLVRKSAVQAIEWKPIASDPGLDLRAVGKCAGAKLAGMTTRLRAPEGLVSFRFSLE
ncbi:MAG TPA: hypothetical protein VFG30_08455 [Polyangiales bacterium]|nr:hypothetical protein [Polyangiales bacterium]